MRRRIAGGALFLVVGLNIPAPPQEARSPAGASSLRTSPLLQPGNRVDLPEPQPGQTLTIGDDFKSNVLDTGRWLAIPGIATVGIEREMVRLDSVPGGPGSAAIVTLCSVSGDFDAQVDYQLLNWPLSNVYGVGLGAADVRGPLGAVGVWRQSERTTRRESYLLVTANGQVMPGQATSDVQGTLRLVRTGLTFRGYSLTQSGWASIGSGSGFNGATRLQISLDRSEATTGVVSVAFDNFMLNAGRVFCPQAPQ